METKKKKARYERLKEQLDTLCKKSDDPIARMATVAAVLYHKLDYFFWSGFYLLKEGMLIVGPYQGPVACQILEKDKGVCWASVNSKKTIIVPDIDKFPGHIACDSRSRSEIVVPVYDPEGKLTAVFDIDARELDQFDETDAEMLEQIMKFIFRMPVSLKHY